MSQETKTKHTPLRTCIATHEKKAKHELLRLVRLPGEDASKPFQVKVDMRGKERGRGANITPTLEAFDLAVKKGALERALKLESKLTAEEVTALRVEFQAAIEERTFRKGNKPVRFKITRAEMKKRLGDDKN